MSPSSPATPSPVVTMPRLCRVALLFLTAQPLAGQGGSGSLEGTMLMPRGARAPSMIVVHVVSSPRPLGADGYAVVDHSGKFRLRHLPVGALEICIQAAEFHTVFDTVTITAGAKLKRRYVLMPDRPRSEPYPLCDRSLPTLYLPALDSSPAPVASDLAPLVWDAVLAHYRATVRRTEGDRVAATARMVGRREAAPAAATVVVKPHRRWADPGHYLPWLRDLPSRGLAAEICESTELTDCPQAVLSTFLELSVPVALGVDTVEVSALETGANPAECRRRRSFIGFDSESFVVVRGGDGGWAVVGRSARMMLAGSGMCEPPKRP